MSVDLGLSKRQGVYIPESIDDIEKTVLRCHAPTPFTALFGRDNLVSIGGWTRYDFPKSLLLDMMAERSWTFEYPFAIGIHDRYGAPIVHFGLDEKRVNHYRVIMVWNGSHLVEAKFMQTSDNTALWAARKLIRVMGGMPYFDEHQRLCGAIAERDLVYARMNQKKLLEEM